MKRFAVLALPLFLATAANAAPAAWQPTLSKHGECQTTIPGNWVPGFAGIGMKAPSGVSQILVSYKEGTLAQTKAMMPGVFKITKTYEDSAARYWVEYSEGVGRHWYVVTPNGKGLCSAVLDFDKALTEADAKTVATGLKKH